jgi:hypothetical protein
MKVRPLCEVSDFVIENFPEALESPSTELIQWCEKILARLSEDRIAQAIRSNERDVATLDLKMIEAGIVHSGLEPPPNLMALVDKFSGKEIPGLSYEEIVLMNPDCDMRIFTRGVVGITEARFYQEHAVIEDCLARAIKKVRTAIARLHSPATSHPVMRAAQELQGIKKELDAVVASIVKLGNMAPEHFAMFRKYLTSHPIRDLKGPSGAFTARIPLLELLFRGDELPDEYIRYLRENWQYFPRQGRAEITEALSLADEGNTLITLWNRMQSPQSLLECITTIGKFFNRFRQVHYQTVKRQIPEAIKGELAGTGGEANPGVFLRERMRTTRFTGEDNHGSG